jgi:hypothetical protein
MNHTGEPREERESQGGGVNVSLSGGDEHSEPESHFSFGPSIAKTITLENGGAGGGGPRRGPHLGPSLSKGHNYNEEEKSEKPLVQQVMSGSQAKTAFALRVNCERMIEWRKYLASFPKAGISRELKKS